MKFSLGNTSYDAVLNRNPSGLLEIKDKKLAIVGSSGILLDKEHGELIDSHDLIVRFNVARTMGYEIHVGSRTDVRIVNGHSFNGSTSQEVFPGNDNNSFIQNLTGETLIVKSWHNDQFIDGILKTTPQNKVYFINPVLTAYYNSLTGDPNKQEATCGLVAVLFFLLLTDKISCFGFNFYKDAWSRKHYWAERKEYKQGHSFNVEEKIFNDLEQAKKIKIYK